MQHQKLEVGKEIVVMALIKRVKLTKESDVYYLCTHKMKLCNCNSGQYYTCFCDEKLHKQI